MEGHFTQLRFMALMRELQEIHCKLQDMASILNRAQRKTNPATLDIEEFSKLLWNTAQEAQKKNNEVVAEIRRYFTPEPPEPIGTL